MKIIHVITAFGIGGAEKLLLNIMNKQIEAHAVYLIYLKKIDDLTLHLDKRIRVNHFGMSPLITLKLNRFFKSVNPDIVHSHLGHADLLAIWSARNLNCRIFCTMHNIYFKKNFLDSFFFRIYRFLFKTVSKPVQVISISHSVKNHVLTTLKVAPENAHLLFNAISVTTNSVDVAQAKEGLQINPEKVVLLFVGRLSKQKSIETLIKAAKNLKEAGYDKRLQILIVGDGNLRKPLERLSHNLSVDEMIRFEGQINMVNDYFYLADLFILPSIWEGFGIVILEAFRAKLAVISSDVEGPSELINHGVNGLLFRPENHLQLAEQIIQLIEDEEQRKKIALAGYQTFTETYQIENYVAALNKMYENAL